MRSEGGAAGAVADDEIALGLIHLASFTIFPVSSIISESSISETILSNGKALDYLSNAQPLTNRSIIKIRGFLYPV